MKKNCWEVKKCGREEGGSQVAEFGVCPAAVKTEVNGVNNGKNAGRVCWCVTGTLCGGEVQGTFADKQGSCLQCEFYKMVKEEEGTSFKVYMPKELR